MTSYNQNIIHFLRDTNIIIVLWMLSCPVLAQSDDYTILISKKKNELIVQRDEQLIKKYHIASGKGGIGTKQRRGDNKTPIGVYRVSEFRQSDRFHYFIQLDYPSLIDAWYGYKNQTIDANDFKRITSAHKNKQNPPQDTPLGGFIGIHGLGQTTPKKLDIHQTFDWTNGCIALKNEEVTDLRQFIQVGTQIIIQE